MFDERVRSVLPRAVRPIAGVLAPAGVSPNAMSAAGSDLYKWFHNPFSRPVSAALRRL